jgi:hypothetical protein
MPMTVPDVEGRPAAVHRKRSAQALRASIASAERWARVADRSSATAPARLALRRRDEREVDPGNILSPADLAHRVALLRRARAKRAALKRWYG